MTCHEYRQHTWSSSTEMARCASVATELSSCWRPRDRQMKLETDMVISSDLRSPVSQETVKLSVMISKLRYKASSSDSRNLCCKFPRNRHETANMRWGWNWLPTTLLVISWIYCTWHCDGRTTRKTFPGDKITWWPCFVIYHWGGI